MAEKEITERFLRRRIRKLLRLGDLLVLKNNPINLDFYIKRIFTIEPEKYNPKQIITYEPFTLLQIKVQKIEMGILVGFYFLQNDYINWMVRCVDLDKLSINEFMKDLKEFEQWKI